MPVITKTTDGLFLGNYGDMNAGDAVRNTVEGAYGTFGNPAGGREATVQSLDVRGFESRSDPDIRTTDFYVGVDGRNGEGINAGDGQLNVTYSDNATVTFTTTTGATFTARMTFVQLSNGDVYMIEEAIARNVGREFTQNAAGREVASFTVDNLSRSLRQGSIAESPWAGSAFPVCFVAGTKIMTDAGEVAVETLKQGDLVMTMDNGLQEVRWIGVQKKSASVLGVAENLRPICIKAGALGDGLPQSDLMVSQQHRMLVRSAIAQKMFGEDEVLVAAKHLVLLDGVDIVNDGESVTYVHFLCSQHEVVFANGAPSETLYTGPEAMKTMSAAARAEILAIFPEVADIDYAALKARTFVNGRKGRQLAVRHKNDKKPLLHLH